MTSTLPVNIYPQLSGAGITQLAECQLPKLNVAGSIPVARSITFSASIQELPAW